MNNSSTESGWTNLTLRSETRTKFKSQLGVLVTSWLCSVLVLGSVGVPTILGQNEVSGLAANDKTVAEEKVRELASQIETLAKRGQNRDLDRIIKWEKVVDRGLLGMPQDESSEAFRKGFLETIGGQGGFSASIAFAASNGGTFRFLRAVERNGKSLALFRVVLPEGGFNYIEMEIAANDRGAEVVDVYPFSNGEWTSRTVRRAFLPFRSKDAEQLKEALQPTETLLIENANDYSQFGEYVSAGEARKAMEIYELLPVALQKDKNCLLLRLRAAQQLGDDEYGRALAMIRNEYPNDPSSDLLSLDAYVLSKRYDEALECISRLEKRVGGDSFLSLQKAGIFILKKDLARAEELANSVMSETDLKLEAYWTLVTISLERKRFAKTVELLKDMDRNFEIEWADLRQVPDYAEFVKTPQYEAWTEYLKGK